MAALAGSGLCPSLFLSSLQGWGVCDGHSFEGREEEFIYRAKVYIRQPDYSEEYTLFVVYL